MTEHRTVLAILAYNEGPAPNLTEFADVMMGERASVKRYWEDNAAGVVAIDRFELAGPYKVALPAVSTDPDHECPRDNTIDIARRAAAAAGIDLSRFDTTLVMLHPAVYVAASGTSVAYPVGASGRRGLCLVPFSETGTYFAHELGHALGFVHSHGIPTTAGDWSGTGQLFPVYGDPYGMMSAQSFGAATPTMVGGAAFAGYPSANSVGPMLARAELYHDKPAHMDQAGLVIHLEESGSSSATVVTAGTGGPGRPELAVYHTAGFGTIFVELRKPGGVGGRNWWDGGLELGADGERDVPGIVVHCLTTPPEGPTVTYAARLVMPGPDADTTFDTPQGRFTLRVQNAQQPLPDEVTFRLQRGTSAMSLMVRQDDVDSSTQVSSEMRPHPRFPGRWFTWEVRDVARSRTYTPTVVGIGVGWPDTATERVFNTEITWNTDTVVELTPAGGTTVGVTWTVDEATSVLRLRNDPSAPAVSLPVFATAYERNDGGQQIPLTGYSTTFDAEGRSEGWGADFLAFLLSRDPPMVISVC